MGKIKLNKDGLKGIFINHVEKMVLGMVLLVFGVFVYSSLGLEGLPADQTPDKLIQSAQSAEKNILNPDNAKDVLATVTASTGYVERAKNRSIPTDSQLYVSSRPITPSYVQEGSRRPDPTLLPPEKVEVHALTGPVVYWMKDPEEDQLAKMENSVATPKVDPVKKKKKKGNEMMEGMMGGFGYGGDEGMSGMSSSGMGSAAMGGMMPGSGGMPGMPGGMPGMPGAEGTTGVTGGTLANAAERPGFVASMGSFPMIARSKSCIAVKSVIPWKKQWEEYEQKFSSALGYNPVRDTPRYFSFTAERLEVSDDPAAPLDWTKAVRIAHTQKTYKEVVNAGYAGFAAEIADPRYLQMGVLTFPVPPFANRDLEPLALHKEVPKMSANSSALMMGAAGQGELDKDGKKKKKTETKTSGEETDEPGFAPGGVGPGGSPAYPGGMPGGMPGMDGAMGMSGMGMAGGMPGMPGGMSGMPGMPGMPGGMPGMPGMPGGMGGLNNDGTGGMSGTESMGMNAGMGMMGMSGGYGYEGDSGSSSGMLGMPGMGGAAQGPSVPYLLIRFFDFDVEQGKTYRYRVQVIMEDPNHPQAPQLDPSDRFLDDSVKKRLAGITAEEKASTTKNFRKYYVRTEFSQPSDPVSLVVRPQTLAGQVTPLKLGAALDKSQDRLLVDEPQAKVMSVVWDPTFATEVTGISEVLRGSYLNFNANGDAVHPVMLVFKSLPKFDFLTDQLIADIRGGEELAGKDKESPLLAPGQYALVNDQGQLIVRNEFDDWDTFRKLTLPEAPEPAATMGGGMGGMGDDGSGMNLPGMMMPGMPGKKGKGGRAAER